MPHADLGIRGRLLLTGPRGRSHYITDAVRKAILTTLKGIEAPVTGTQSTLVAIMGTWVTGDWGADSWRLIAPANTQILNAHWQGYAPGGQTLTEARVNIQLTHTHAQGDDLLITVESLLTNPSRATGGDAVKGQIDNPDHASAVYLQELPPTPFVHLDGLRRLMLDILATLWGPLGQQTSTSILGQPLGPPAQLDLAVFTIAKHVPSQIPVNDCVEFDPASLVPGSTPLPWTSLDPIQPDHQFLNRDRQEQTARDWLIWFGLHNGYQDIEQALARHCQA